MRKNAWNLWRTISVLGAWAHEYQGVLRGELVMVLAGGWQQRVVIRDPGSRSIHGMGSTEANLAFERGQDWLPSPSRLFVYIP